MKIRIFSEVLAIVCLVVLPMTDTLAARGCCSHHGGMAGCTTTGKQLCKDGTVSRSCKCNTTKSYTKEKKSTTTKTTPVVTTPTTSTTTTTTTTKSTKGCCARHGGVAGCNKSTGYYQCKDGSQSASCKCI